jgi:transcriptional regulator with XRE-family HTH domain
VYIRLRDLREDHDLNQTAVARYLHITQATYSRYESGILDVPSKVLIDLALFYNTSVDYLLGLTDDAAPPKRAAAFAQAKK